MGREESKRQIIMLEQNKRLGLAAILFVLTILFLPIAIAEYSLQGSIYPKSTCYSAGIRIKDVQYDQNRSQLWMQLSNGKIEVDQINEANQTATFLACFSGVTGTSTNFEINLYKDHIISSGGYYKITYSGGIPVNLSRLTSTTTLPQYMCGNFFGICKGVNEPNYDWTVATDPDNNRFIVEYRWKATDLGGTGDTWTYMFETYTTNADNITFVQRITSGFSPGPMMRMDWNPNSGYLIPRVGGAGVPTTYYIMPQADVQQDMHWNSLCGTGWNSGGQNMTCGASLLPFYSGGSTGQGGTYWNYNNAWQRTAPRNYGGVNWNTNTYYWLIDSTFSASHAFGAFAYQNDGTDNGGIRGTCGLNTSQPLNMFRLNDQETLVFNSNGAIFSCDFTDQANPTWTQLPFTPIITGGTYASQQKVYYGIGWDGVENYVTAIGGFTGNGDAPVTSFPYERVGRLTQDGTSFKDFINEYGITYLLGHTSGSPTYSYVWAVDNTNPAVLNSTPNKHLITIQNTSADEGSIALANNVLYNAHQNSMFALTPASQVFGTHSENNIYTLYGANTFQAISNAGTDKLMLCYNHNATSIFDRNKTTLTYYNITSGAEIPSQTNPTSTTDITEQCNQLLNVPSRNKVYADMQDMLIIQNTSRNADDNQQGFFTPYSTHTSSPGAMDYDQTTQRIIRAVGANGIVELNTSNENYVQYAYCQPTGSINTTSVALISNNQYVAVGNVIGTSQGVIYACDLAGSGTKYPVWQFYIDITSPRVIRYDLVRDYLHIIGATQYDIYALPGNPGNQTVAPATLYNYVKSNSTNQPITGAVVTLSPADGNVSFTGSDTTSSIGLATITQIPPGNYLRSISATCYQNITNTAVTFAPNEVINVTSYMIGNQTCINNLVINITNLNVLARDQSTNLTIPMVNVSLQQSPGAQHYSTLTNATGTASFLNIIGGDYDITANATGYDLYLSFLQIPINATTNITIYMTPTVNVTINQTGNTTIENMTLIGSYTDTNSKFKDLIIKYGIGYILGHATNTTEVSVLGIDNSNPPLLSTAQKRKVIIQTTTNSPGAFTEASNVIYIGSEKTIYTINPADKIIAGNFAWGADYTILGNVRVDALKSAGSHRLALCTYLTNGSMFKPTGAYFTWYNTSSSTELPSNLNPAYYDIGDPNLVCNAMLYQSDIKLMVTDAQSQILLTDQTDTDPSGTITGVINPTSTLNESPSAFDYEPLNLVTYEARGQSGIFALNIIKYGISILGRCQPIGNTITYSVATADTNIYYGLAKRDLGNSSETIIYACTQNSTGYFTPFKEYPINLANPKAIKYDSATKTIHVLGENTYQIYILGNQSINITGTASLYNTIRNANTNELIVGAAVTLLPVYSGTTYNTTSNYQGVAVITNITSNDYMKTTQKAGYLTSASAVTFTSNELINVTSYLTPASIPLQGNFTIPECTDTIKGVWICNMVKITCDADTQCPTGRCEIASGDQPRHCSAFNYTLCDAAGRPRNNACFIKYTSQGSLKGIANWTLGNWLYFLVIVIIIFLILTWKIAHDD
jgi:hypothetical protein